MEYESAHINWWKDFANSPQLTIILAAGVSVPARSDYRYSKKGNLYYGFRGDHFVSYFSYSSPGKGYGGATWDITMLDGTKEEVIGPWSSRASAVNTQFPHCVDVTFKDSDRAMGVSGAVTLRCFIGVMASIKAPLVHIDHKPGWATLDGEISYEPAIEHEGKRYTKAGIQALHGALKAKG